MRAYDRYAIETCHVPGMVLMENAGRGAADVISNLIDPTWVRSHVPGTRAPSWLGARVVVVCGAGNNGGDGFVVARHLLARGADVEVFLVGASEKVMGESRINHDAYIDLGGKFHECADLDSLETLRLSLAAADIAVDALFGTGLDRPVRGALAEAIAIINQTRAERGPERVRVVALDVPSGLDSDSGAPLGTAVLADHTVTFGHLKVGLLTPAGARLSGHIHVVDLGVPDRMIVPMVGHIAEVIGREVVSSELLPRDASVHKHQAGNVLVVAGSSGKLGAAFLAGSASMRAGAGLVTLCTWPDAKMALEARVVELMTARIDPERIAGSLDEALAGKRAVAVGPGLGLDERAKIAVDHLVLGWDGIKVVDADALTHFVGRTEVMAKARGHLILTPHPGELGRLLGRDGRAIEEDRFGAVLRAVELTRATVVLKGARTIVATPDKRMFICMAGNPVLATAGAGDVLTGIIAAFACHLPPDKAACAGVLVHALAGDLWRARTGSDRGMLASEIAALVPEVLAALMRGKDPLIVNGVGG
ncbi:MAG: NAD(P)H-hydrate dehydratase [Polyangiaceae bacterium]|nr:NAD(P)H-hydrate dehydratase [Polyangiaceae bacterium]